MAAQFGDETVCSALWAHWRCSLAFLKHPLFISFYKFHLTFLSVMNVSFWVCPPKKKCKLLVKHSFYSWMQWHVYLLCCVGNRISHWKGNRWRDIIQRWWLTQRAINHSCCNGDQAGFNVNWSPPAPKSVQIFYNLVKIFFLYVLVSSQTAKCTYFQLMRCWFSPV